MDALSPSSSDNTGRTARNFFWITWTGVAGIASSMLVWVFMARLRDVDDVGRFTIVMGLFALFVTIAPMGLMPYMVNEISRRVSSKGEGVESFISSSAIFFAVTAIACSFVMTAASFVISGSTEVRLSTAVLSLSLIPSNLSVLTESAFISLGRARFFALISSAENLLRVVVPLGLILAGADLVWICGSLSLVKFLSLIVCVVAANVRIADFDPRAILIKQIVRISPTFAATGVFAALNWQAPLFLLAYLGTEAQSASFGTASRFLIPVTILLSGYVNAIHPVLARKVQQGPDSVARYLGRAALYPVAAALIGITGSFLLSEMVLALFFGSIYSAAAGTLNILAISVLPFALVMIVSRGLIATGHQRIDLCGNVVGLAACVAASLTFIPEHGATGAAAGLLACFVTIALFEMAFFVRILGFRAGRDVGHLSLRKVKQERLLEVTQD